MTVTKFWIDDSLFIAYVIAMLITLRLRRGAIAVIAALSLPFWPISNGWNHVLLTLLDNTYSPSAITAAGLYLPLSIAMA